MDEIVDKLIDMIENKLDRLDISIEAYELDEIREVLDNVVHRHEEEI